jgi:hypothetical protein
MTQRSLTASQRTALLRLRKRGLYWIADETERRWRTGLTWYIDRRVSARGIRRLFARDNRDAAFAGFSRPLRSI